MRFATSGFAAARSCGSQRLISDQRATEATASHPGPLSADSDKPSERDVALSRAAVHRVRHR